MSNAADTMKDDTKIAVIDGTQLRQIHRTDDLSRESLAWTAGLGITTLSRLEKQSRPRCRYQTLERLAAVFDENPRAMTADGQSEARGSDT
jgi:hypothetical protein